MRTVYVKTDNRTKLAEIEDMLKLYGVQSKRAGSDFSLACLQPQDCVIQEQTTLNELPDQRLEHVSQLTVTAPDGSQSTWVERVKGVRVDNSLLPEAYDWDTQFVPLGSNQNLHELKLKGLKVSARQMVVGSWVKQWLHYDQPVQWQHMEPVETVRQWLENQPLFDNEHLRAIRETVLRVDQGGAWFKQALNRRSKHYWWPGLNAGIPTVPKKDLVHEMTFLMHDLMHWTMPDVLPTRADEKHYRVYVVTRMISEAITMIHADMYFIDQALKAGLEYDTGKRRIYPIYNPAFSLKEWCQAMSLYAILGLETELDRVALDSQALVAFKDKYAPFFEEDVRWTAHNARHLLQHVDPQWMELYRTFAGRCDLGLYTTDDYVAGYSDQDEQLVRNMFEMIWARYWDKPQSVYRADIAPQTRALQRWYLGQLALTFRMSDIPISKLVRDAIVEVCLTNPQPEKLQSLKPLWKNYIDILEGLNRLSSNDAQTYADYYPVVPPFYVSYDQDKSAYQGIASRWEESRKFA